METRNWYQVIDTANGTVVAEFPTHRRALNHTRKLEPEPTKQGRLTKDWRYLIQPIPKS